MPARGANDTYGSSKSAGKGPDRRAPVVNRELIRTFTKAKPTNHAQAPRSDSANARSRMPAVRRDGKLSGQRPGDRPADTAARAVRRRRHLRTAGQGGDGRLGRQIHDRSGEARHIPAVGVDAGLSERAHSGIHRFGRHAVHRNRARKRSAGNRNGHGHAFPVRRTAESPVSVERSGCAKSRKARVRTATSPASYAPIPESRFRP